MKTNELMPGDWVTVTEENNEFIGKVQAINAITNYCIVKVGGDWHGNEHDVFIEDMQPVPLTPEILEKNGFEVSSEHARYYFEEDGEKYEFVLRKMYDVNNRNKQIGWSFYAFNVLSLVDYVHELQHALRLCNIEKEIIL